MRRKINRQIWSNFTGKKLKPEDDGLTWIVGGILVIIGLIIGLLIGD